MPPASFASARLRSASAHPKSRRRGRIGFLLQVKIKPKGGQRPLNYKDISMLPLALDAGIALLPADVMGSLPSRTQMEMKMAIANLIRGAMQKAGYQGSTVPPWEPSLQAGGRDFYGARRRRSSMAKMHRRLRRRHSMALQRGMRRKGNQRVAIDAIFTVYLDVKGDQKSKRSLFRTADRKKAPRLAGITLRRIILEG